MEQLEKKITNYCNHRRFTLKCLGQKVTPVSLRLSKRSNIKTLRGIKIILNNTIDVCINLKGTCMKDLKELINDELYEKCHDFIKKIREHRHKTIQERQVRKFN